MIKAVVHMPAEVTQDLRHLKPSHLTLVPAPPSTAAFDPDQVEAVIDGAAPIPAGLDRESIEALRRIARAIRGIWGHG